MGGQVVLTNGTGYVALLRAVNLGGATTLAMAKLKAACEAAGFGRVRTYIASGNAVFEADAPEAEVKSALEREIFHRTGRRVEVIVRTAAEMAQVARADPFPDVDGYRKAVIFLDSPHPGSALKGVRGLSDETLALGAREIYVHYPSGQGRSKLVIPSARFGTARNMNTVAKLAAMAAEL